ncbi:oligosaccharide flippase family protein [Aquimarina intermedia]|uniref:O-antigen/teichoic acid export membrane protein n=1 Tax=Aquimarina intermedia TaxID=350814 RepID=A0A5S5C9H0_9FLAO|nr:oligosaccharide flippase family protein [Aquimarina intermedia]TYP75142.1 O-antigen/teichoic acid export membrane protein [Aquimarina intermedia]
MSQIKKGALLNYVTIIITNVVGLLLTPFIIQKLGDAEYGVYLAIGALVGSISVLDFGLNNTIVRFVAKYQAEKDIKAEENFLGTVMLIYVFISALIVAFGTVFYFNIDTYFTKMSTEEIDIAKTMFIILLFNLAIRLPGGSFTGICSGYERFVYPKMLNIIRYIVRSIMVLAILFLGGKAISIVIIDTIMNLIMILLTGKYVFYNLRVRIKLHTLDYSFIKQILRYSIWVFVFSLVSIFQWKAGHIILGNIAIPEVLAIYGVGIMLGTYYGAFSTAISSVFLPRATQMTASNATSKELTDMMIKIGRVSFILLIYILGAFILYGKQFVYLWVGENYHDSWLIALFIMIAYTIPLTQGFTGSLIEAQNKVAFKSIVYLLFLSVGTGLGYFLAREHGAIGMIVGTVIGWLIAQNVMNYFYHRTLKLNIFRFFKELFYKTLFIQVIIVVIGLGINFIPGNGWVNFFVKCLLYTLTFSILMYSFGMISYEKQIFKTAFEKLKTRK